MRLWHHRLIRSLPRTFLLAQHRDCCALRGRGWGKKSPLIRYVYDHTFVHLVSYHRRLLQEMVARGFKPDLRWMNPEYRGRFAEPIPEDLSTWDGQERIWPEHTDAYFFTCVALLRAKVLKSRKIGEEEQLRMNRAIDSEILALGSGRE